MMQNGDPTPMRRRLVSRRDEPVVCESCGAKVERRMRGQRSARLAVGTAPVRISLMTRRQMWSCRPGGAA